MQFFFGGGGGRNLVVIHHYHFRHLSSLAKMLLGYSN